LVSNVKRCRPDGDSACAEENQSRPDALALAVRVNVKLVDEVAGNRHEPDGAPVRLSHEDGVLDQYHSPKVGAIFLRRMSLSSLKVREG
jgi:hypothetical protein